MAVEAAEALVAKGIMPAPIVYLLMELISLIPSAVSPQMNGTDLAAMVANRYLACMTVLTVSSLLLEEAETVKEEAGVAQLQLWRPTFRLLKQFPLLPHRLVRLLLTRQMQTKLVRDPDLAVDSINRDAVAIPDNYRVHPIMVCLPSRFPMCPAMLFRLGESMKHPVEQSMIYPLLTPQVKMKLTALLKHLGQVGIGSHFCLQETQLMCLVTVELNRTLPHLWLLVPQRLLLNLVLPTF